MTFAADYSREPDRYLLAGKSKIASFLLSEEANVDEQTVASFGEEWLKFSSFSDAEIQAMGDEYFDVIPEELLTNQTVVLDLGCGSGRWSRYIAPKVRFVEAVDPSDAVFSAAAATADLENVRVSQAGVDNLPFADDTFDMIVCLGVLHHIPDTALAIRQLTPKLKHGGHLLLYLYYDVNDRPWWYRALFELSNLFRRRVSVLPAPAKKLVCDMLAVGAYLPLVSVARLASSVLGDPSYKRFPLSYYVGKSWTVIRNDCLDRFGTPLEQRFSRYEIAEMLNDAGFTETEFSDGMPKWHCRSRRRSVEQIHEMQIQRAIPDV